MKIIIILLLYALYRLADWFGPLLYTTRTYITLYNPSLGYRLCAKGGREGSIDTPTTVERFVFVPITIILLYIAYNIVVGMHNVYGH